MLGNALEGVTVIDFTQIAAGPVSTMLLADMGARVIKVEPPHGEMGRGLGPGWIGDDSALFHGFNRNKQGVSIDLKTDAGAEVAHRLIAGADIVVESMRPGVMARLGLGPAELCTKQPALIYCSISAYGQEGPYAQHAGVDGILQADAGLMSLIGTPGSEPCKVQAPVVDVMTGYIAALGIVSKLAQRARDGRGGHLDVNLFNAALALQQSSLTSYLADAQLPVRAGSAAPYAAPNQAFRTADGWIMVAAYMPDRWRRLCEILKLDAMIDDPRFATSPQRVAHRTEMVERLTAVFATRTTDAWIDTLQQADILCARVATYDDVVAHPQAAANRMIVQAEHPVHGTIRMPGFPISSSSAHARTVRPAPRCGEHTSAVLREFGYGEAEIRAMREAAVIHGVEA
ncbi:CoA transferase [Cupriavidus sp. 2SB]|uniref:CaiB/BaiF CoA transferase family protein n=1 Tax=unclassified Cupriavidus TaxID=2640874 RepID=UPI0010F903B2|nr:CoA transferase [Cupriavidus sp. 2SB]